MYWQLQECGSRRCGVPICTCYGSFYLKMGNMPPQLVLPVSEHEKITAGARQSSPGYALSTLRIKVVTSTFSS